MAEIIDHVTTDACSGCRHYWARKSRCELGNATGSRERVMMIQVTDRDGVLNTCSKREQRPEANDHS